MIVLLHGFGGDRTSWDEVCVHWQPDQPVVALDLPGHGRGPLVRRGWQANLEAVRDEVGGERLRGATVVGYSLGARVALGLVARALARRAVLVSVNPGIDDGERRARRAADAQWTALLRDRGDGGGDGGDDSVAISRWAERWTAQPLFASQARLDERARARRRAVRLAQAPEQLARSLEEMGLAEMPDYRGALPALAAQLELVVGQGDAKFAALAAQMVALAPELPLHVVADCGHDVPLEQPRALAAILARAFRSPRRAS
jgi:2-succinyl-6-hydroxy-2,4-cyclohexadiene-1-carboxylate synthase